MARAAQSDQYTSEGPKVAEAVIREHLRGVLESPAFQGSLRSRDFLAFVVRTALEGHSEQIKERTIAEMVFGRHDYDPTCDTLVRVTAGEVRKRLAKFYQSNPASPIRISLAAGSYVPAFLNLQEPPPTEAVPAPVNKRRSRTPFFALAATLLLVLAGAAVLMNRRSPLEELWQPMLQSGDPVIIANPPGNRPNYVLYPKDLSEFQRALRAGEPAIPLDAKEIVVGDRGVSLGNMLAILSITGFIREHGKGVLLRIRSDLAPEDMRNRPVILIGAFSNAWTLDESRACRFRFIKEQGESDWLQGILDTGTGRKYFSQLRNHATEADLDYAVVSRISSSSGQFVLTAAGVSEFGTQVAGEFVTSPKSWSDVVRRAPSGWHRKNFEILLETKVVGRSPGAPKLIEAHFW